ncbi:MAG TPA: hypothetical protein VJV78_36000 [Polyangiales bacterium]|nr:hypothetical protein [Polyangiales bacterium]
MVAGATGSSSAIPQHPRRGPGPTASSLRDWLAFDERPALIEFAMTLPGRALLFGCFALLLACALPLRSVPFVLAGCAAAAFLRERRDVAVLSATFACLMLDPSWYTDPNFEAYLAQLDPGVLSPRSWQRLLTVGLFAVSALSLRLVVWRPQGLFARRPVVCLLGVLSLLSALTLSLTDKPFWLVLSIKLLASYMWFMCYAVIDQRSQQRSSTLFALGLFRPFWGSSSTPIGKGAGYLAKLRCDDPRELAQLQLKGLKLLAWSLVLRGASLTLTAATQRAGIPELSSVVQAFSLGEPHHASVGWIAIVTAVAVGGLELAVWGHRVVACARLAGYRLRRNTWRPLASRSLADFWNRYYFYFKELLLDFFFYPTFFRVFKRQPRLRTFCATFMAAGVGNAIYHFARDIDRLFNLGAGVALGGFGAYMFYCTMLAGGIAISQLRAGSAPRERGPLRIVWSFVCVWGFVCCLQVFGAIEDPTLPFTTRVAFMLHQFGVNP